MPTITIERSLGWLADLFSVHVYRDDVPEAMRRRWSFDGGAWTLTDDPANEVMRLTLSGDFTDQPALFADATVANLAVTEQLTATIEGTTLFRVTENGTAIGPSALPVDDQNGALLLMAQAEPEPEGEVFPLPGILVWAGSDVFRTMNSEGAPANARFGFVELYGITRSGDPVSIIGDGGVNLYDGLSEEDAHLGRFYNGGSGQTVFLLSPQRAGYAFEATAAANQYLYFRVGESGTPGSSAIYFDTEVLQWRSHQGTSEYLTCSIVSSTTRQIGIPARTTNGTGANIRIQPQPVNAGRGGVDLPGSLDLMLGQCIATGGQTGGFINLRDHLGVAVSMGLYGQSGEAATSYLYVQGAAAGTDGRARNVALGFNSAGGISLGVGATNVDLTMDATNIKFRYSAVTLLQATANGQAIGGDVEATQNGSLRIGNSGVPSAAPAAGTTLWTANGQLRTRGSRNVISEMSTGKPSTTTTPSGPTRCFDRQDSVFIDGGGTVDKELIAAAELPGSSPRWVMRVEIQWSAFDADDELVAGGRRFATVKCVLGTVTVVTSAANQVDGTDDDETASVTEGASMMVRTSGGAIQFRCVSTANSVYFHARIIATLWEH